MKFTTSIREIVKGNGPSAEMEKEFLIECGAREARVIRVELKA